ncbi:CCA tRNA nucleotidyltransferase [Paenibacillus gansuensis]|uniref:CCA tRNA nucleotidyltransferase n=1 Tax=Paenibacillus gansuensis TaxID=306542 RepID=A0ABW5PAS1_9BACL
MSNPWKNELEHAAADVLYTLEQAGYEAVIVGGYVRDRMLGRAGQDIDMATSALPEQVMRLFPRTAPTGLQHGTVTVISGSFTFEVTTYRKESEYEEYRRPGKVEFVSDLHEDLRRRDFTMNAMAMDARAKLIDPWGGMDDLKAKVLRCVGDADARFQEDALRMLRCVRFAASYALEISADTWTALRKHRALLTHIARERVRAELDRTVEGPDPDRGVDLLQASGLLQHVKGGLPLAPLFTAAAEAAPPAAPGEAGRLARVQPAWLRWAQLLLLAGRTQAEAEPLLRALTFPNGKAGAVSKVLGVSERLQQQGFGRGAWVQAALRFGREPLEGWLALAGADPAAAGGERGAREREAFTELTANGLSWLDELPVAKLSGLALSGGELMQAWNRRGGPWTGQVLASLLEDAAFGRVPNEREALLLRAERYREDTMNHERTDT